MAFRILYHPEVKTDISRINKKLRSRIKKVIETRLMTAPQQYGEPLKKTLKGYWKLRVGDYRIVFKVSKNELIVFAVIHRKTIYEQIGKRL